MSQGRVISPLLWNLAVPRSLRKIKHSRQCLISDTNSDNIAYADELGPFGKQRENS